MYPILATIGAGFFIGILIGYALKKVSKLVAIVIGLFFAGLAYLQYKQIVNINWNTLEQVSQCGYNSFKCYKVYSWPYRCWWAYNESHYVILGDSLNWKHGCLKVLYKYSHFRPFLF
jgi:hypothetical protein